MKVNVIKIKLMVVEFTFGLMVVNMMASGRIITCMAKVFTLGKMVVCMKATMKTIESMGMEYTLGTMVNNTKVSGSMENSMEKEFTEKMDVIVVVYGKMAKDLSGLKIKSDRIINNLIKM